jgi:hypothetical protein
VILGTTNSVIPSRVDGEESPESGDPSLRVGMTRENYSFVTLTVTVALAVPPLPSLTT